MKLYYCSAKELENGHERFIQFLVKAKTLPSANKKAYRVLKTWESDNSEVDDEFISFYDEIFIPLRSIYVAEITPEQFVEKFIHDA